MLRRDPEATAKAGFADPRSYVSFDGHQYLFGRHDVGNQRLCMFFRDQGLCHYCGCYATLDEGELHHLKGGRGRQRCWCDHNLVWACGPCHRKQHVQIGGRKSIQEKP